MIAYIFDFEHFEQTFRVRVIAVDFLNAERIALEIQPRGTFTFIREELR